MEAKLNTVNMIAWVHKECDVIEEEALTKLQEAWDSSEQKDECVVRLKAPSRLPSEGGAAGRGGGEAAAAGDRAEATGTQGVSF